MVSRNRLQFSENLRHQANIPVTGAAKPRAIGSILDAVLARYGIEVEEVTVELTKNNTTIISSPARKSAGIETKSASPWTQRFLF